MRDRAPQDPDPKPPGFHATKAARKAVYRRIGWIRSELIRISPPWLRRIAGPVYDYLDMFFVDHGIFRLLYANRHRVSDKVWRSAQPWPHQIGYYARRKSIRTIVNLRGERDCGSYRLEARACDRLGIALRNDLKLYSRGAPTRQMINDVAEYFAALEYPVLFHCKSGADRAGLAGVLYLHLVENVPIEQAASQLSLRYGHFKQAKTGILDYFFRSYLEYSQDHEISFVEWVNTVYEPEELAKSFKSNSLFNTLVDKILRRE